MSEMSESSSSDNPFGSSDSNSSQQLNDSMENSIIITKQNKTDSTSNGLQNVYNQNNDDDLNKNEGASYSKLVNSKQNQINQQVNHHEAQFNNLSNSIDEVNDEDISDCEDNDNEEDECDMEEGGDEDNDEDFMDTDDSSSFSSMSGFTEFFGQEWRAMNWIQCQMTSGANPRVILSQILMKDISPGLDDFTLWKILASMLTEPPRRQKLSHLNTIDDVVNLLRISKKIIVLTGAGVSVSCGIPDFRSADGIYARLAKDYPDLPDPQAMFDIQYFSNDPRPFYKFAREIYPGQFTPSLCHRFIKLLEEKGKLLRNYTQNIDTLEQVAGICNVIECHGSFATASCTKCKFKLTANDIREQVFTQKIPVCPKCQPNIDSKLLSVDNAESIQNNSAEKNGTDKLENIENTILTNQLVGNETEESNDGQTNISSHISNHYKDLVQNGIMKPDIVFFGEGLPDAFHSAIADDKDECDLLIVIGSSMKVRPVALIPNLIPPNIPQVFINLETLPHMEFDVELLGDSDTTITKICQMLGDEWIQICSKECPGNMSKAQICKEPKEFCSDINPSSLIQQSNLMEPENLDLRSKETEIEKSKFFGMQLNLSALESISTTSNQS